jgi:hypothetical protein
MINLPKAKLAASRVAGSQAVPALNTKAMSIDKIDVRQQPDVVLQKINSAISQVGGERAKLVGDLSKIKEQSAQAAATVSQSRSSVVVEDAKQADSHLKRLKEMLAEKGEGSSGVHGNISPEYVRILLSDKR